jgi:CBS-domain-containing membrane protein
MTTRITSRAARTSLSPATAAQVMTPNPKSINRHATVRETAEILHEHGIHIAPVIDDAGRPIGVVSRTDLLDYWGRRRDRLTALAAGELNAASAPGPEELGDELTVPEIMTPVVFGVRMNAPIASIVEKMIALEVRYLFVTDGDGVLVGTISVFDVLRHISRRDLTETPKSAADSSFGSTRFSLASAMPP